MLDAGGDDFVVAAGPAGLDHRRHAGFRGKLNRIVEWEERIRSEHSAAGSIAGFFQRDFHGIHAAHLAGANTNYHLIFRQYDRVRLHKPANRPSKTQVVQLAVAGFTFRDDFPLGFIIRQVVGCLAKHTAADLAEFVIATS